MAHVDYCRSVMLSALKHYRPTFQLDAANEALLEQFSMWLAVDAEGLQRWHDEHAERTLDGAVKGQPLDPQRGILLMGEPGRGKTLFLTALGAAKRHLDGKGFANVPARSIAGAFERGGWQALAQFDTGDLLISDVGTEDDVRHMRQGPVVNTFAAVIETRSLHWDQGVISGKQDLTFLDTNKDGKWLNLRYLRDGAPRVTSRLGALVRATTLYGKDWRPHVPAVTIRRPPSPAPEPEPLKLSGPELSAKVAATLASLDATADAKKPFAGRSDRLREQYGTPEDAQPRQSKLQRFAAGLDALTAAELSELRKELIAKFEFGATPFTDLIDGELQLRAAAVTPLRDQDAASDAELQLNPTPTVADENKQDPVRL